jgi:hypothetical protein
VRSWQSTWQVVFALAVQDALHALVHVGMHSVTVVTFFGCESSPHFASQRFSQLCFSQRPHGPRCAALPQESLPPAPSQSERQRSMQLGALSVVAVVVQSFVHELVHELSHSVEAVAVHDVSQSL